MFMYVRILQSKWSEGFYVGLTDNLRLKLKRHNAGAVIATAKFRPWRIKTAVAFSDAGRAARIERYLKTASGRAFTKKHL